MKFRIIREGGKFFIEHLHGIRWVGFPKYKIEKFDSPEKAERWLIDNENWKLVKQRELIKEINIDPNDFDINNEPCIGIEINENN